MLPLLLLLLQAGYEFAGCMMPNENTLMRKYSILVSIEKLMQKLRSAARTFRIAFAKFVAMMLGVEGAADVSGLSLLDAPCDDVTLRLDGCWK